MFEKVCVSLRLTPFKISIASGCHGSESYHSRRFLSEHTATKGDAMESREVWRDLSWEPAIKIKSQATAASLSP